MRLTKFGHSCVRVDDGNRTLVVDPGAFSDRAAALDGAQAVLVTHEHFDHVVVDELRESLASDPRLQVWAPRSVADQLGETGGQVTAVGPGETFTAAGFEVTTFGGQHAVIHRSVPVIANVGYVIDDAVYHPGDALAVPPVAVGTLLLPAMAPWSKLSEVVDFAVSVRARQVLPIHDFLVKDVYQQVLVNTMQPVIEPFGIAYSAFDGTVDA